MTLHHPFPPPKIGAKKIVEILKNNEKRTGEKNRRPLKGPPVFKTRSE
jgi:hypothetical protein